MAPRAKIPVLAELPLELETERLILRPFRDGDADDVWPHASNPELPKYMSWAVHQDKAETRAYLALVQQELAAGEGVTWAIVHGGKVVGSIALDNITWQVLALRKDTAELGYWLAQEEWGHGLMTEAVRAVLGFAFHTLGLHKVTTRCFEPNVASRRVIEKSGFRRIGVMERDVYRDGQWYGHIVFEMLATSWADVATTGRFARPDLSSKPGRS